MFYFISFQTEIATEKGEWEAEGAGGPGADSGGRVAAASSSVIGGVPGKGGKGSSARDNKEGGESDRGSEGSETASVISSAEDSDQLDSSDAVSTGESGDESDSENDSDTSVRSFVSKGSMASRLSSSRKKPGRGKHGRSRRRRRSRIDGSPSGDKRQRGQEGSTFGDDTASAGGASDVSSDSEGGAIDLQPEVLFDDILKGLADLEQLAVCTVHSECFSGTLLEQDW